MKELLGFLMVALKSTCISIRNPSFTQTFGFVVEDIEAIEIKSNGGSRGISMEPLRLEGPEKIADFLAFCNDSRAGQSAKVLALYRITIQDKKGGTTEFHATPKLIRKRSAASEIRTSWRFKRPFEHGYWE